MNCSQERQVFKMGWKDDLEELDLTEPQDLDDLAENSTIAKTEDVGFVNPKSGAGILGREDGVLEGFADYGLGFRFSRDSQSLMVFAPSVHIFSSSISKHDKIVRNTYLKDEYGDIEEILSEGENLNEKL
ncbi:hypothetical protein S100141_04958 (plasmid) [Bacillus licheniformis]|nr:hypothetical protein S100141_04958 [Bacillus licheniformis]